MLPSFDFWESDSCHVAVNPHRAEEAAGLAEWAETQGLAGMCFFQTSGSEGVPKWVALSKRALLISAASVNAHFAVTAADRWLIALPLFHVGGFAISARAYLSASAVVHDETRWQPHHFASLCEREKITLVSLVPAQVHDLVRDKICCPPSLRAAIIGGGGLADGLAAAARRLGWPVFTTYGMTEAASQIATQPYDDLSCQHLQVLPHWQLRVNDAGRLVLCGPALAAGYVQLASDCWNWLEIGDELLTRDVVRLWENDRRHFLQFTGREEGFVKILGELVHLAPLQAKLDELAMQNGIASAPVIAPIADERCENRLLLVVDELRAGDLLEAFNAGVPPFSRIREIRRVSQIPRTALGKVDSVVLRSLLADVTN